MPGRARLASARSGRQGIHQTDLDSAYAALAKRFREETFSPIVIGGAGAGKLRAGLVTALLAAIILMVAKNCS